MTLFAVVFNVLRYLVVAGGIHWMTQRIETRRISKPASLKQARRDLQSGLLSSAIFGLLALPYVWAENSGFVVTTDAAFVHTPAWHVASLLIMLFVQDFCFYWSHRAMHTRLLFNRVHALHHRSSDPTALTAFSFTPYEALIQALPCVLVYALVPSEAWVKLLFLTITFVMAVIGHTGFELFPAWLVKSAFCRVVNSTTHHHMHHHSAKHNFGLYVRLWDRLFGTEHPHYEATVLRNAEATYVQAKLELETEPG